MKVFAVVRNKNICFVDFNKYKIASHLIPDANILKNENPLANKQWTKLVKEIDKLEVGQSLQFGDYTVIFEDVPDHIIQSDIEEDR